MDTPGGIFSGVQEIKHGALCTEATPRNFAVCARRVHVPRYMSAAERVPRTQQQYTYRSSVYSLSLNVHGESLLRLLLLLCVQNM